MRTVTIAFIISFGLSMSALAGGKSGVGAIDWKAIEPNSNLSSQTANSTPAMILAPQETLDLIGALSLISKYIKQVKDEGNTLEAHEKAAYEWGYEVGDPVLIGNIRLWGEMYQALKYSLYFWNPDDYHPYEWEYIKDSFGDMVWSELGALDKEEGLTSDISRHY